MNEYSIEFMEHLGGDGWWIYYVKLIINGVEWKSFSTTNRDIALKCQDEYKAIVKKTIVGT